MVLLFIFSLIGIEYLFVNILCYLSVAYILSNILICNYLEFEDIFTLNVYNQKKLYVLEVTSSSMNTL